MITVTAAELGIDINEPGSNGVYKWLLASFLIGKRIRTSVAVKAYHLLVDQEGLGTPDKLCRCSHAQLVKSLGKAGYARYDESTARRLRMLGRRIGEELQPRLCGLRTGAQSIADFEGWLMGFDGVGPKTVEIFMREAAESLNHAPTYLLKRSSPRAPAMQPKTEGLEEQGPDRVPFVNDPAKKSSEHVELPDDKVGANSAAESDPE